MEFTDFPARIRNIGKKGKYVATTNIKVTILAEDNLCSFISERCWNPAFGDPALPDVQGGLREFGRSRTPSPGKFGVTQGLWKGLQKYKCRFKGFQEEKCILLK